MQEPTESEMIRTLGLKLDLMTEAFNRLASTMGGYVTKERYEADMLLRDHKQSQLEAEVKEGRARTASSVRLALSAFVSPLIVGVVIWVLNGGK